MRRLIPALALALLVVPPLGAAEPDSPVVARIGKKALSKAELDLFWGLLPEARRNAYNERNGQADFLDDIVNQYLMLLEAERLGLHEKLEIKTEMKLASEGVLTQKLVQQEVQGRVVPDKDVRDYYNENKGDFKEPEMVHARHILVTPRKDSRISNSNADDATDEATAKAKIERIKGQVAKGEDFEELARAWSEDVTADRGGDLGFFPKGRMVAQFEEAIWSKPKGFVTGIVETTYGYHIIEVVDRNPERVPSYEDVEQRVRALLSRQRRDAFTPRFTAFLDELRERFPVKLDKDKLGQAPGKNATP